MHDLAVIICATRLEDAYRVCRNVENTSGLDCLFFIHDNTFFKWSLAKTYNFYSRLAKSKYILLCHQDVFFSGSNWGLKILEKLSEKKCGAIGFAGSVVRYTKSYYGWPVDLYTSINNYNHVSTVDKNKFIKIKTLNEVDTFLQVVVLDGMALFCRKSTIINNMFDEHILCGFHCYDIDFTMNLHVNGYKNYVYNSNDMSIIHYSTGNYSKDWILQTISITNSKWSKLDFLTVDNNIMYDSLINSNLNKNFMDVLKKNFSPLEVNRLCKLLKF